MGEEEQKDLSESSRNSLLQEGYKALAALDYPLAGKYFGAAIRKARRHNLWDIESEYCRLLCLYFQNNLAEAINRCVVCLDSIYHLKSDEPNEPLPYDATINTLENILAYLISRNGAGLLDLVGHFWKPNMGERYQLKRGSSFMDAFGRAWQVQRTPYVFGIQTLQSEMREFGRYISKKLENDEAKQTKAVVSQEKQTASDVVNAADTAKKSLEVKEDQLSLDLQELWKDLGSRTFGEATDAFHSKLSRLCETTTHIPDLIWMYNILKTASKPMVKVYVSSLSRNPVIRASAQGVGKGDIEPVRNFVVNKVGR